ncbi:MAG TPA: hypothetical protein PLK14_15020 [Sediminibacterium sp.]|nr:hypothetical protein [Sediminibacterium sp.]
MELIYDFAKYGDLFFNFSNHELTLSVPTKAKTNLVLDLHQDYTTIANNYKKDLCNNLDKANKYHPVYSATNHYSIALNIYQKQYGNRFHWVSKRDYGQLARLLSFYQSKSQCLVRELKDPTTEDLLSSTILLKDEKRLYLLINVITPKGRQISSNHFLIDRIIQEFAGTNLQLDFEGSEIPGVQDFFKNFHPFNQPYFHVHYNHLRWPLRVIKK